MADHALTGIAIYDAYECSERVKRDLLVVDRIGFIGLGEFCQRAESDFGDRAESLIADLTWLQERGLLLDQPAAITQAAVADPNVVAALDGAREATRTATGSPHFSGRTIPPEEFEAFFDQSSLTFEAALMSRAFLCRAIASSNRVSGEKAVSLLPVASTSASSRDDVLEIVLNELPIPGDDVPLDEVIAFRDEALPRLRALRLWAVDLAKEGLSRRDAEDKFVYLLEEYQESARNLPRTKEGLFSIAITVAAGAVHPVLGVLVAALQCRQIKAQLSAEEKQIAGRELSYVIQAGEQFKRR
jgi:hypothetical protein